MKLRRWLTVLAPLLVLLVEGCRPPTPVEDLPPARVTLDAIGRRLGRSMDPVKLGKVAQDERALLKHLTFSERDALGRGALTFRVDRAADVFVIAPTEPHEPFWLVEQGFAPTGDRLRNEEGEFRVHRREFPAGMVGLGVNALDRSSRSHYGIMVRSQAGGPVELGGIPQCDGLRVVPAGPGFSLYSDGSKPFATLPASMAGALIVRTDNQDRHRFALSAGRVWKTRQPSSSKPDQVVVSFGQDPSRELSISWRTDLSVSGSAVRIVPEALKDSVSEPIRYFKGDVSQVDSAGLLNDPTIFRHRVKAQDLQPDTVYAYSVGPGSSEGWSPWYSVRTAPASGSTRDFSFLYMGDAQNELERWGVLLHDAWKRRPDAGFLILAGDLVDRGNERSNWDHFFLRAAGVFESLPLMPAVGNHEYLDRGPEIYRGTFDLPPNGAPGVDPDLCYSFEYSDAFVAVLDSNLGIDDPALAQAQADWLDRTLGKTRATWKFVTFHHPVYASHVRRENPQLGRVWGPVFDKHHVDLVLQGHDHAYLRTKPMRGGQAVASPREGTVYVVAVSGEKFYEQDPRGYTARGLTEVSTYQTIDVKVRERTLRYRAFDREGREVDSLVITKPPETEPLATRLDH